MTWLKDKRALLILILGIFSGFPLSLTASTLTVWFKEAGVSIELIGLLSVVGIPYTFKFLWSPLVDSVPIPLLSKRWGMRKSWLIVTQLALFATLMGLSIANPLEHYVAACALAFGVAFASASQDIVIDAFRIEYMGKDKVGEGSAAIMLGYRIGMLFSSTGCLLLAEIFPWNTVYIICAAFYLVAPLLVIMIRFKDDMTMVQAHWKERIYHATVLPFKDYASKPHWLLILFIIMLYKLPDALAGSMTNVFLLDIGFTKTNIAAIVKTYGLAATLAGFALGGMLFKYRGLIQTLFICGILQTLSNLLFIMQFYVGNDIPVLMLTITLENLTGGMASTALVAFISSLCSPGMAATQYALLSSIAAFGRTWLSSSSGLWVKWLGWANFYLATAFVAIPGLLLLLYYKHKILVQAETSSSSHT